MNYTENHHVIVLSTELNQLIHNQPERNRNFNINKVPLPTDVEINAVIPLEGESLM